MKHAPNETACLRTTHRQAMKFINKWIAAAEVSIETDLLNLTGVPRLAIVVVIGFTNL